MTPRWQLCTWPAAPVPQKEYPTYQQLDSLLRSLNWTQSSKPLLKRVSDEMEFLQKSLEPLPQNQQQGDL